MVKANELRIGNYLLNSKDEIEEVYSLEIEGINGSHDQYDFNDVTYETCSGISLTPELLEQCGYILREKRAGFDMRVWYHPTTMIFDLYEKYPSFRIQALREINKDHGIMICERLDYLHQLQNLYFALIGKELQVNIKSESLSKV